MSLDIRTAQTGDIVPAGSLAISAEHVGAYLDATGEDPEHWPGLVPPLALGALALAAITDALPLPAGAIHSSQEFDFLEPVPVGAELAVFSAVERASERRGSRFVTLSLELRLEDRVALRGRVSVVLVPPGELAGAISS